MIRISYESTGLANLKKGTAKKILKRALLDLAQTWHSRDYPKRFKPGGANKYHLKNRNRYYIKRAKSIYPSWRPLVASGELMQVSTSTAKFTVNLRGDNISVRITYKRGHATKKYITDELQKVLRKHLKKLLSEMRRQIIAEVKSLPKERYSNGIRRTTIQAVKSIA